MAQIYFFPSNNKTWHLGDKSFYNRQSNCRIYALDTPIMLNRYQGIIATSVVNNPHYKICKQCLKTYNQMVSQLTIL